jgi:diacylglycerol kinase (ATP)
MPDARATCIVILNPIAGGGAGRRMRRSVERELGRRRVEFEIRETEGTGHAVELADAASRSGVDTVVAVGGDGTVHEVANGLLTAPPHCAALAAVSVGTGNDFVKVVDGLRPHSRAFDTIAAGASRMVDAGHVTWGGRSEYFVNAMGTGVDVDVARQIARSRRLPGGLVYLSAVPRALVQFRATPLRAWVDGAEVFDARTMMLAVGNGRSVGGMFRLFPDASPTDGLLDVCIIDEVRGIAILRPLAALLRGTHARMPVVHTHRGRVIELELPAGTPLHFQLDGELREGGSAHRLRIELNPAALRVATAAPHPATATAAQSTIASHRAS